MIPLFEPRVMTTAEMDRIHAAMVGILSRTGLQVEHAPLRELLAEDNGGQVIADTQRVVFPEPAIKRFLEDSEPCDWDDMRPRVGCFVGIYQGAYLNPESDEMQGLTAERLAGYVKLARLLEPVSSVNFQNYPPAIATRTGAGQVIYGGIRDAQQILEIPDFCTFCKGVDPTPIRDVTLVGLNTPCRIGEATCMPGDVVLGTYSGVLFIPPHLAEEVLEHAERTHMREVFSHTRLREGIYTSSQMDTKWTAEIETDFEQWRSAQQVEGLEDVDWESRSQADEAQQDQETLL